jgi:glycosyltransferase involved in cell wall biosynthesis
MQHYEPLMLEDGRWYERSKEVVERLEVGIANSTWLLRQLHGSPHLVFPGVELKTFRPGERPAGGATLRVASLGRSEPWKGLQDLVSAIQALDFEVELITFGDDATEPLIDGHRRAGRLSADDLAALYRAVDVVVTPSWYESFPLPPLEAMATGTAVLTTRDGTEDYASDDENCLVVPPRRPDELARALNELRSFSLRRRLGSQAAEDARRFTWEAGFAMFREAVSLD